MYPGVLASFEGPQGGSDGGKIDSAAAWGGYVAVNIESGRIFMVLGSSYHSILAPCGGPRGTKIKENSLLVAVQNEKHENVVFLHPSLAKSLLLGSNGTRNGAPICLETIL